jgi:hypothetical protein
MSTLQLPPLSLSTNHHIYSTQFTTPPSQFTTPPSLFTKPTFFCRNAQWRLHNTRLHPWPTRPDRPHPPSRPTTASSSRTHRPPYSQLHAPSTTMPRLPNTPSTRTAPSPRPRAVHLHHPFTPRATAPSVLELSGPTNSRTGRRRRDVGMRIRCVCIACMRAYGGCGTVGGGRWCVWCVGRR